VITNYELERRGMKRAMFYLKALLSWQVPKSECYHLRQYAGLKYQDILIFVRPENPDCEHLLHEEF
jgi:hypothetical protein